MATLEVWTGGARVVVDRDQLTAACLLAGVRPKAGTLLPNEFARVVAAALRLGLAVGGALGQSAGAAALILDAGRAWAGPREAAELGPELAEMLTPRRGPHD